MENSIKIPEFKGQALNTNLIIFAVEAEHQTASGLNIASDEDKNQRFQKGYIVSVGPDCPKDSETNKPLVKIGDTVWFDKFKQTPFLYYGEHFTDVKFADLIIVE
jgi:co-chaperonin GroES (HSP10)